MIQNNFFLSCLQHSDDCDGARHLISREIYKKADLGVRTIEVATSNLDLNPKVN